MTQDLLNILLASLRPLGDITRVTLLCKPSTEPWGWCGCSGAGSKFWRRHCWRCS